MTEGNPIKTWMDTRSVASRRVMQFGLWSFAVAFFLVLLQYMIWSVAGWGGANFVPVWALIAIYLFGVAVGLSLFYFALARTTAFEGKAKWGGSILIGVVGVVIVVGALAGSLPQLLTLVVSKPVEIDLTIHKRGDSRHCRGMIMFGPIHHVPGSMCTGFKYWPVGHTQTFHGYGNALAVRLTGY